MSLNFSILKINLFSNNISWLLFPLLLFLPALPHFPSHLDLHPFYLSLEVNKNLRDNNKIEYKQIRIQDKTERTEPKKNISSRYRCRNTPAHLYTQESKEKNESLNTYKCKQSVVLKKSNGKKKAKIKTKEETCKSL